MFEELLFLDFDGTYWPRSSGNTRIFEQFATWIQERPKVGIVISSNWRNTHPLDELKGYFHPSIEERVFATLPLVDENKPGARQALIEGFVSQYSAEHGIPQSTVRFAALDDTLSLFKKDCPFLVLCEYRDGMTSESWGRVLKLLEPQKH